MLGVPRNSLVPAELEHGVFQAIALVLHAVHQTLGPNELRRQQRESKKNNQPPWAGCEEHNDTHQEKRKPGENTKEAANLLDGPKEHGVLWGGGGEPRL